LPCNCNGEAFARLLASFLHDDLFFLRQEVEFLLLPDLFLDECRLRILVQFDDPDESDESDDPRETTGPRADPRAPARPRDAAGLVGVGGVDVLGPHDFVPDPRDVSYQRQSRDQVQPEVKPEEVVLSGQRGEQQFHQERDQGDQRDRVEHVVSRFRREQQA